MVEENIIKNNYQINQTLINNFSYHFTKIIFSRNNTFKYYGNTSINY